MAIKMSEKSESDEDISVVVTYELLTYEQIFGT
jgi:hypothetical protein